MTESQRLCRAYFVDIELKYFCRPLQDIKFSVDPCNLSLLSVLFVEY